MMSARSIVGSCALGRWRFISVIGLLCLFQGGVVLSPQGPANPAHFVKQTPTHAPAPRASGLVLSYGKLPLAFEVNQGQTNGRVKFLSQGSGYALFLTSDEAVLTLERARPNAQRKGQMAKVKNPGAEIGNQKLMSGNSKLAARRPALITAARAGQQKIDNPPRTMDSVLRMKLVGANARAAVIGADELPGKSNYFIGNDPKKWRTNVPNYAQVRFQDVYPGVDLVYYGNQGGQLEYDFVVAPGADPNAIALDVGAGLVPTRSGRPRGAPLRIAADGDLVVRTNGGEVRFQKPVVYQVEQQIDSLSHRVIESLKEKEPSNGSVARSLNGAIIINHQSPTTNHQFLVGHYVLSAGSRVSFAVGAYDKTRPLIIDPVLSYSTYLGGGGDSGNSIAVDSGGNAYITGVAQPTHFPTTPGAFQTVPGGLNDAFVIKLNAAGSALVYSTYLGGSGQDQGTGIAVDSTGNAYVTGWTQSVNFPTASPLQGAIGGPSATNAFVTKLNATGNALVYSTYLGGVGVDEAAGIALDLAGNAYIMGQTDSLNFPLASSLQARFGGGSSDAFVTKLNTSGSALVYSTYLGGNSLDEASAIAIDSVGNAYITGWTQSTNFPTASPFQPALGVPGAVNAFVTKLNAAGSALVYSTYLGGNNNDYARGIAVDSADNAYVTGFTTSTNFPIASPFQPSIVGLQAPFVTKLNATGSALVYSTYLGGSNFGDQGLGIAVDSAGNAYVTGFTASATFPTASPIQAGLIDGQNAFVTNFNAAGSALVYSTYLGGSGGDMGNGIALDSAGNAYLTGFTRSADFPITPGAYQTSLIAFSGAFVAKIAPGAAASAVSLSAPSLTFGAQNDNTTSAPQTETVTNTGTANLSISTVTLGGANAGDFATSADTCTGATVTPARTCTVGVTFTPSAAGIRSASLIFTDNAANSPQSAGLMGTGVSAIPLAGVSPASLAFGNQNLSTTSASQPVTLSNTGTGTLTITSFATSANFGETNNCGGKVAASASCTINVTFSPTAVSLVTGTLVITENSNGVAGSTQTVTLSGTGTAPVANLSAPSLSFGNQPLTTSSAAQTETVTNTGTANLSISTVTVGGTNAGDFAKSADTCTGATVAPNGTCTVNLTFTPAAKGAGGGTLTFTDNNNGVVGSTQTVTLSGTGTGPVASLSAPSLSFGNQPLTTSSAAQTETVTNTGTANLSISAVAVGGTNAGDFAKSADTCTGATVAPNGTCTVNLTFTPAAKGAGGGTLTFTDNNNGVAGSTQSVNLSGTGADFAVASLTGTQTVVPGGKAEYTINVSSAVGTFSNAVTLACSNLPAQSTCEFGSNPDTPGASGASSPLTITTAAAASAMMVPPFNGLPPAALPALLLAALLGGWRLLRRKSPRWVAATCMLAGALLATTFMGGCGQGGYPLPKAVGTPAGTYTVTVSGTSGSTQHTTTVTLTVAGS